MFRWKALPRFATSHAYPEGAGPADHHPPQWPRLERYSWGQVLDAQGRSQCTVAVASTPRSRDGWTYNVVELKQLPIWVSYFHHTNGQRVEHARSEDAQPLAEIFGIHRTL